MAYGEAQQAWTFIGVLWDSRSRSRVIQEDADNEERTLALLCAGLIGEPLLGLLPCRTPCRT